MIGLSLPTWAHLISSPSPSPSLSPTSFPASSTSSSPIGKPPLSSFLSLSPSRSAPDIRLGFSTPSSPPLGGHSQSRALYDLWMWSFLHPSHVKHISQGSIALRRHASQETRSSLANGDASSWDVSLDWVSLSSACLS